MVRPRSPHLLALITVPLSVRVSAGAGRSFAVRMALTPDIASAASAWIRFTRACGMGLSNNLQNNMPSARKSSAYFAWPVTFAYKSGVVQFLPISLYPVPYWRSAGLLGATTFLLSNLRPPQILSPTHHRGEDLVIVLAAAQASRDAVRQLLAGRIGICFQVSHRGHDEAGHAKRTLKSLFVDDALLHRMQGSIGACEALDGQNFSAPHRVREHRTGIVRNIVDQDGAGSALRTVAPQFGTSEAQLVTKS